MSVLTGYGRGGWNSGPYGQTDTSVSVTGVSATSAVGSITVNFDFVVSATGVSGTGSVNSVAVSSAGEVAVTGVAATSAIGSVTVETGTSISFSVTGVSATGSIGSVTVTEGSGITVSATGISATGSVGSVTIGIGSIISATGVSATGSVGSVIIGLGSTISATGVTATGSVGSVSLIFSSNISVTGVAATGETQNVLIWGLIDDSQSITYSLVDDSQTVTYTDIDTNPIITFIVTVYPKTGGGNAFYIDGVERPVLTLIEGKTYRFDTSNSTTALHPLRLSTTSDGTHAGGSIYSDNVTIVGTQGQSGSYLQIVVVSGTPTLYYFCTVHSGMGNQINTPVLYTNVTLNGNPNWEEIAA